MLIRFIERRPPSIIVLCAVVAVTTFAAGLLPTALIISGVLLHSGCRWIDNY